MKLLKTACCALLMLNMMDGPIAHAAMTGDADTGKRKFRKCLTCHEFAAAEQKNRSNGIGPSLTNLFGRPVASVEGFKYSNSLAQYKDLGIVWNSTFVLQFLENSTRYMESVADDDGNVKLKPLYHYKVRREQDRIDILVYLLTVQQEAAAKAARTPRGRRWP